MTTAREPILTWEGFFLGGFSIVVCLACWAFTDKSSNVYTMSQLAFGLAFLVNNPHFLSSYKLLYGDFNKSILKKPKYFWAAVVAPFLIAGGLIYALATRQSAIMSDLVNIMYFTVGWHYTKQVFGCVIVTSARRKMYFSKLERRLLLGNLFSLWALSWLKTQVGMQSYEFYGIHYQSLNLPIWLLNYCYAGIALTALGLTYVWIKRYINEGRLLNPSAWMALGALYVWYLPAFSHPFFAYLIPFFHSLQYLAFVWSFKKNQVSAKIRKLEGREWRKAWFQQFVMYMVMSVFLGAMSFEYVPKWLDAHISLGGLGSAPFLASAILFINIHHYFIDNVIWRSNNDEVKAYLFVEPAASNPTVKAA